MLFPPNSNTSSCSQFSNQKNTSDRSKEQEPSSHVSQSRAETCMSRVFGVTLWSPGAATGRWSDQTASRGEPKVAARSRGHVLWFFSQVDPSGERGIHMNSPHFLQPTPSGSSNQQRMYFSITVLPVVPVFQRTVGCCTHCHHTLPVMEVTRLVAWTFNKGGPDSLVYCSRQNPQTP